MTTIAIDSTIQHGAFTFTVRSATLDDDCVTSATIDTPDGAAWDPQTLSTDDAYPTDAILRAVTEATGRRVELVDGRSDGQSEVWTLRDLGAAVRITVEVGRHTIDPQGIGTDEECDACEGYILDAVRAEWPGAEVDAVGNGGRTSGYVTTVGAPGVRDITEEVRGVVNRAFDAWMGGAR